MELDRETKDLIIQEVLLIFKMNNEIASQVSLSVKGFVRLIQLLFMVILVLVLIVIVGKYLF